MGFSLAGLNFQYIILIQNSSMKKKKRQGFIGVHILSNNKIVK